MSKSTSLTLLVLGLVIFVSVTQAARPVPAETKVTQQPLVAVPEEQTEATTTEEGCGVEECMMRRTLEAHLDYIYTQDKKH